MITNDIAAKVAITAELMCLVILLSVWLNRDTNTKLINCSTEHQIGWFDYGDTESRMTDMEYKEFCEK